MTDRSVDLWLAGFKLDPYGLIGTLRFQPEVIARQGDPQGHRRIPARRNLLVFRKGFAVDVAWSDAVESLISALGGWAEVKSLIDSLDLAEEPLVQLNLPIRDSPHQENDFIPASLLGRFVNLRLAIGFEFGTYGT